MTFGRAILFRCCSPQEKANDLTPGREHDRCRRACNNNMHARVVEACRRTGTINSLHWSDGGRRGLTPSPLVRFVRQLGTTARRKTSRKRNRVHIMKVASPRKQRPPQSTISTHRMALHRTLLTSLALVSIAATIAAAAIVGSTTSVSSSSAAYRSIERNPADSASGTSSNNEPTVVLFGMNNMEGARVSPSHPWTLSSLPLSPLADDEVHAGDPGREELNADGIANSRSDSDHRRRRLNDSEGAGHEIHLIDLLEARCHHDHPDDPCLPNDTSLIIIEDDTPEVSLSLWLRSGREKVIAL